MTKKEKCSASQKGRIVIHLGDDEKRVFISEINHYLSLGWQRGISDRHRKSFSESFKGREPWNKNTNLPEHVKQKISNKLKNHVPWNAGLTKETDERVLMNTTNSTKTKIEKYGSAFHNNNMNEEHKMKISRAKMGVKLGHVEPNKLKAKQEKEYLTKKKNNSFNSSNVEEDFYRALNEEYKSKTIYRNYKCDRYPFYCDFYIKEDDLFIELNAHWTHGGRPFDPNDSSCQEQLKQWQEKSKTSLFYKNAIETWTVRDVQKREIAKKNNLNYKTIY